MRRTLVAVTLASALLSTPSGHFLQPLWDLVSSLWASPAQEGCGADPNGRCLPQLDAGCGADPNGLCKPGS